MAELTTLARPYAKAAFESAVKDDQLAEWSATLAFLAQATQDEDLVQVLDNPNLTGEQKADVVIDVCEGKLSDQGRNFIKILAENKRLTLLPEIAELFELYKHEKEGAVDVTIASPFEVTSEQQDKLAQALSRKLDRNINVTTEVDQSLIGGVVIRAGDTVIDASVRGKLAKLAEAIGA
ncbi:F0F1 ATP synthase subunit delta [Marinobacteraceae bacterium S3BR75-40.1]